VRYTPLENAKQKPKLALIVTDPITVIAFFQTHIRHLSQDYYIHLFAGWHSPLLDALPVKFCATGAGRQPSIASDLKALIELTKQLRRLNPAVVLTVTPKAALLGQLAAKITMVPERIHYFTGQVWATKTGLARQALKGIDKWVASTSTRSLTDSPSQREFLIQQGVMGPSKVSVLGMGSISGVDTLRFAPDVRVRKRIRASLSISSDACVFLFLGRLNSDKGIHELLAAFADVSKSSHLLLVGPCEDETLLTKLPSNASHIPFTDQPEQYFAASDVFVLFSKREGFGTSALEASAAGLPVVASKIYGLVDAVVDGETGLLVELGDAEGQKNALQRMFASPELRQQLGEAGRKRALQDFDADACAQALLAYLKLGQRHG